MTDSPQRPPRPDRPDEELARFHNGDTLDNIPIVRSPSPPEPPRQGWLVLLALAVAAVGALAGVGIVSLAGGDDPAGKEQAAAPPARTSAPPSTHSAPSDPAPSPTVQTAGVEQVRIIQTPQTGGDPSSDYCLVYTGSFSGPVREAILLMGAPAYQCSELLPFDPSGETPAFTVDVPDCVAPARPAVVTFAEPGGWEGEVQYTCLTEHNGA
ncbi:hypothetical protein ABZ916_24785 [Streptomyces sp. NPDC046853]|uniref:hypothetical protein n=1 Tax=Streptomyces sp. NPDC046853 TaxID=3154920 RepID=UPI0033EB50D3